MTTRRSVIMSQLGLDLPSRAFMDLPKINVGLTDNFSVELLFYIRLKAFLRS